MIKFVIKLCKTVKIGEPCLCSLNNQATFGDRCFAFPVKFIPGGGFQSFQQDDENVFHMMFSSYSYINFVSFDIM